MKIYQVTSVVVYRSSTNPLTLSVHATGLAATSGWTNPRLDNSADPKPADAVHEFSFEADKPTGIVLEVLTQISATFDFKPKAGADAVIVSSRTNSITVHSSEFVVPIVPMPTPSPGRPTTLAIGEEGFPIPKWPTMRNPWAEHPPTTFMIGEEGRPGIPPTSPMIDDPVPFEPFDPRFDPWGPLRGPFGTY